MSYLDTVLDEFRAADFWQKNEKFAMDWHMAKKNMRQSVKTMRSSCLLACRMLRAARARGANLPSYFDAASNQLAEYRAAKRVLLNREWGEPSPH